MDPARIVDKLRQIELLASLTEEELASLLGRIRIRRFERNQTILGLQDTNRTMYLILEGRVKVVQLTEEGKEVILALHGEGEFFGEMSLLDGKTTPAEVRATTASVVALISREDFFTILSTQPKVVRNLLQVLCSRLRTAWRTIEMLNLNNAAQRMRTFFLNLARKYGKPNRNGVLLDIRITHQDIADMTGLTRETVTRVLDRWRKEGGVAIRESRLIELSRRFLHEDRELKR